MSDYSEHLISMAGGDGDVLDQIQARADAATLGPWITVRHDLTLYVADTTGELDPINLGYVGNRPERNAEFIAHARTDVPALLALVRKQAAKLDAADRLAIGWTLRGESDMAFSKTIPDPDIAIEILTNGARMVENARHIRAALEPTPWASGSGSVSSRPGTCSNVTG